MPRASSLPATRFVGRAAECAALRTALQAGQRAVVVLGPPGIGKTRLVTEFLRTSPGTLVDLTEAATLEDVCGAVAGVMGLDVSGARQREEALAEALADLGPITVVLDNCEQVAAAVSHALTTWLDRAPEARFVATSRHALRVGGQHQIPLGPLALPDGTRDDSEAVVLFVDRAQTADPSWSLPQAERAVLAAIVRRLDGIPLAIELAASRVTVLGTRDILERLDEPLKLLRRSGAGGRHTTLRAAIASSWELLGPAEKVGLAQLSVFRGGFFVDAAEAVLRLPGGDDDDVVDVLHRLRQHSLLTVDRNPKVSGRRRLRMLMSIRDFAAEQLDAGGMAEDASLRHAHYYLTEAERLGAVSEEALRDWMEVERDNGLTVARRFVGSYHADTHVAWSVARQHIERMLATTEDPSSRGRLLHKLAHVTHLAGQFADSDAIYAELYNQYSSDRSGYRAGILLGDLSDLFVAMARGATGNAARVQLRARGRALSFAYGTIGVRFLHDKHIARAERHLEAAYELTQAWNDAPSASLVAAYLGICRFMGGDRSAAKAWLQAGLGVSQGDASAELASGVEAVDPRSSGHIFGFLGAIAALDGDRRHASALFERGDRASRGSRVAMTALRVMRGFLDVDAARAGDEEALERMKCLAQGDDDDMRAYVALSLDVGLAVHALRQELEALRQGREPRLDVGEGGRWFRLSDGSRVTLPRTSPMRHIFVALALRRQQAPGVPLSLQSLLEAGWPGETISEDAAPNRFHVTLNRLRKRGLRDLIITDAHGWYLSSEVALRWIPLDDSGAVSEK